MKITSVLRCFKQANFHQLFDKDGLHQPYAKLYLLNLLKQSNPALFTDYTASPRKSANFSGKTLPSLLHEANNLESYLKSAIDYLSTSRRDIDEISLVAKKYRQLLYENPQICDLHGKFVLTLENEAVQFLRKYPGYTISQNGFGKSLALAVELYKIFPPLCREYYSSLENNLPHGITKEDFLPFLFTLSINRRLFSPKVESWLVKQTQQLIDSMSIHDICFLLYAFEKRTLSIRCKFLIAKIQAKILKSLNLLDPLSLTLIMKGYRILIKIPSEAFFLTLWNHLKNQPQRSVMNCRNLNKVSSKKLCYLEELTERLLVAINQNYAFFSPGVAVEAIKCAAHFQHGEPEYQLIKQIVDQIKDDEELLNIHEMLAYVTSSLCALDIHDPELLDKVLSTDWLNLVQADVSNDYNVSGHDGKGWMVEVMLIRDYCMIEHHPHYQSRLTNLNEMYKLLSINSRIRPTMGEFFQNEPLWKKGKIFKKKFVCLSENIRRIYPHMQLYSGYLLDSAIKPSLVMYDNPDLKNILESGQRPPSSLEGCIAFEITTTEYSKRNHSMLKSQPRLRQRILKKLGLKTIQIYTHEIDLDHPDPFHFIESRVDLLKNKSTFN